MCGIITLDDCKEIVAKQKNTDQNFVKYVLKKKDGEALGFLGEYYLLIITDEENLCHNYFVKTFPSLSATYLKYVKILNAFAKEVNLYEHLLPQFQSYFDEKFLPTCYLSKETVIVLEDLLSKGYEVKENFLTRQECKCLLKSLAKLHAASIIYEELRTEKDKPFRLNVNFPEEIKENAFEFTDSNHPRYRWLKTVTKTILDLISLLPEYADKAIIEKLLRFIREDLEKLTLPSFTYRNVLSHADLWKNNALFKESQCVLVDFQLARYAPPALDVLITIYMNVTYDNLQNYFHEFLNTYYEEFCLNLQQHNFKSREILPKSTFMESIELYKLPASLTAAFYATHVFVSDELQKLVTTNEIVFEDFTLNNRSKYLCFEFKNNDEARDKLSGALKILIDNLNC